MPNTEVFQNTDTDTEVGIPNTEKYRIPKKKIPKNDKSVFQFCKYKYIVIRVFTPVLAANSARLNHFHDPSIQ